MSVALWGLSGCTCSDDSNKSKIQGATEEQTEETVPELADFEELVAEDFPIEQDYVPEANQEISQQNYRTELDRIEKEIEADRQQDTTE